MPNVAILSPLVALLRGDRFSQKISDIALELTFLSLVALCRPFKRGNGLIKNKRGKSAYRENNRKKGATSSDRATDVKLCTCFNPMKTRYWRQKNA